MPVIGGLHYCVTNLDAAAAQATAYFVPEQITYMGGPAFYLILNNLMIGFRSS
ncbi:MAG TPA: hypothetical protein VEF90_05230 [Xanthobacteraceae bacterium]|nr:hypothetical protein [Xanthobacteraceae bacterium]